MLLYIIINPKILREGFNIEVLRLVFQLIFFLVGSLYLGIGIFSLFKSPIPEIKDEYTKFAVLVSAYDYENISSLKNQKYPKSFYDIFVISNGSIDLSKMGVNVIHGDRLKDGIDQIIKLDIYNAIAVFKPNNIVDPYFLFETNLELINGKEAVQGYVDIKNPNSSWIAHACGIWYWITNRILQTGFHNLGAGAKLNSTGFCLTTDILKKVPFNTNNEYTLNLALNNIKIAYSNRAVVYDEKPSSFSDSIKQRQALAKRIMWVQGEYTLKLIKNLKFFDLLRLWSDILLPLCFGLFLIIDIFAFGTILEITEFAFTSFWTSPIGFTILNIYLCLSVFVIFRGLAQDKKLNKKLFFNLFGFFVYILSWIPIGILGILKQTKK